MPIRHAMKFAAALLLAVPAMPAAADDAAAFYKGRVMTMVLAGGAGGPAGAYSLMIKPWLEKHIPGGPTVTIQYMPGAGGVKAANYIYNVLPKDGSGIGLVLAEVALSAALQAVGIRYDPSRFAFLGGADVTNSTITVMKSSGIRTLQEAMEKEVVLAAGGKGSQTYIMPMVANAVLGTKFKPVLGYDGINDMHLAMERGEAQGRAGSWGSLKASRPQWIAQDLLTHLVVFGPERDPDLPDVPLASEFARTPLDRKVLDLISDNALLGRVWVAPPDLPADRVAALRDGFRKALTDPQFAAEAKQRNLDLRPVTWERAQKAANDIYRGDPAAVARLKDILGVK